MAQKPQRKITDGPIRNKERTMTALINAVGKVLKKKGYAGLGISTVSEEAKVDKKLIYAYFGGFDKLVDAYLRQRDHWYGFTGTAEALLEEASANEKETTAVLLTELFDYFYSDEEMQQLILWEISQKHKWLRKKSTLRDSALSGLSESATPLFDGTDIDFPAIQALLTGGIYYSVLSAKSNGNSFNGIDLKSGPGRERIKETVKQIVDWSFTHAKKQQKANAGKPVSKKKR